MKSGGSRRLPRIGKGERVSLCIAVVLCTGLLAFWLFAGREEGDRVEVVQRGTVIYEAPLNLDHVLELEGNVVVIREGTATMTQADCPDQICVRTGTISHANRMITCLPNQVVVKITGEGGAGQIDSVAN